MREKGVHRRQRRAARPAAPRSRSAATASEPRPAARLFGHDLVRALFDHDFDHERAGPRGRGAARSAALLGVGGEGGAAGSKAGLLGYPGGYPGFAGPSGAGGGDAPRRRGGWREVAMGMRERVCLWWAWAWRGGGMVRRTAKRNYYTTGSALPETL